MALDPMTSDHWISEFSTALERSLAGVVPEIARFGRNADWRITPIETLSYESVYESVGWRFKIKLAQVADAKCPVSKRRFEVMGRALEELLAWWSSNRKFELLNVIIHTSPDVIFVLWMLPESFEIVGGFESRNSALLTFKRGKEFFGEDWEPFSPLGSS